MSRSGVDIIPRTFILLLCLTALPAVAQQPQSRTLPADPEHLRQVLAAHAIRARSRESLDQIPKSVLYQTLFKKIQREIDRHAALLSNKDRALIMNLPSHLDARFLVPIRIQQTELCQQLALQRSRNHIDLNQLSAAYEAIRENTEAVLAQHYEQVLSQLSPSARELIEGQTAALEGTQQLSYSSVSLLGVAEQAPAVAREIIEFGCTHLAQKLQQPPEELLMKDERVFALGIAGDN